MPTKSPGGKSVGRVTIRVLPDTSEFKDKLDEKLRRIEKQTHFTVTVDKAKLDRVAIRESLQKQFDRYGGFKVAVAVDLTQAKKDVNEFVRDTNKKDASINVNAATAAATAQMRFLTRDRFVEIIARLNQPAARKVAAQLAALTGARVAFNWMGDILEFIGDLDKKLPMLSLIITSIGALVSVLLSATSGLLGIGAGLAAIVPLFLVLPGMILGTAVAITAFGVAMAEASKELAPLSDDMQEIADLIQSNFWDKARDPIIHLTKTLMPQLREAFADVSESLGNFTAKFAEAFEKELAGGKLRQLFKGIADSFDILATGTEAFAGAIVSLSAVAAKYSPRLAQWFVDIANKFDRWLAAVSNDGRLDGWIENGIDALKDLGRAVVGIGRQFRGLWRAAEAGGGGINGFADSMEHIAEVIESPKFQRALSTFFRGAAEGTQAVGDGFVHLGDLLADLADDFSYVLAGLGTAFGEFLADLSDAMNTPAFGQAMRDFVDGLNRGFQNLGDYLPDIVKGIEGILKFGGKLAETLGGVLGAGGAVLAEVLQPLLDLAGDISLTFGNELEGAFRNLQEPLGKTAEKLASIVGSLVTLIEDQIPELTKIIGPLLDAFNRDNTEDEPVDFNVADIIGEWTRFFLEGPHIIADMIAVGDPFLVQIDALQGKYGALWDQVVGIIIEVTDSLKNGWSQIVTWWESLLAAFANGGAQIGGFFTGIYESFVNGWAQIEGWWNTVLVPAWTGVWAYLGNEVKKGWDQVVANWTNGWAQIEAWWAGVVAWYGEVKAGWDGFWKELGKNVEKGWTGILDFFRTLPEKFKKVGTDIINGLKRGVQDAWDSVVAELKRLANSLPDPLKNVLGINSPSTVFRDQVGKQISAGIALGIKAGQPEIDTALKAAVSPGAFSAVIPSFGGGFGSTYNASFNVAADPGIPLADQVFQASQRLKARTLVRSVA